MRRTALHLLVALTLAATLPTSGAVLCVGADGHGAIEVAGADCCRDETPRPDALDGRCTHGCTDTQLANGATLSGDRRDVGAQAAAILLRSTRPGAPALGARVPDRQRQESPSGPPPRLASTAVQLL